MEISKELQEFLKDPENQELLNNYEFEELYKKLKAYNPYSPHHLQNIGQFSALMYEIGVDPLMYTDKIPRYFLYKQCILVKIPSNITAIGDYAFGGSISLRSITIPENVTYIGEGAFGYCPKLTEVIWNAENCTEAGSAINPIFQNCINLTQVIIGKNVKTIPSYSFMKCSKLTSITIPDSVTSIGEYAFSGCSGLTSITIPDSVTSIGRSAFEDCSGLTSITIPDGVTFIGNYAFYDCGELTSINFNGTKKQWENITKDYWNKYSSIKTIRCIDGDIEL